MGVLHLGLEQAGEPRSSAGRMSVFMGSMWTKHTPAHLPLREGAGARPGQHSLARWIFVCWTRMVGARALHVRTVGRGGGAGRRPLSGHTGPADRCRRCLDTDSGLQLSSKTQPLRKEDTGLKSQANQSKLVK